VTCLEERGLIDAFTGDDLKSFLKSPVKAYIGFDPTADSLHLGNFVGIQLLAWLQRFGHTPVIVLGGATGKIGDPSGKSKERPLLDDEMIAHNLSCIRKNFEKVLDFSGKLPMPLFFNNADWFSSFRFIDFLRDVGKHFRIGAMLAKESVKSRIQSEEGMSFTEFSYQLIQSYDFYHLFKEGVSLQMGGSDQWGNITAGVDLIRKLTGKSGQGLTFPLLTRSDGKKFGKSEEGAIWLSEEKLSAYQFYQYLVRIPDEDVIVLMKRLTFMPIEEIGFDTIPIRNDKLNAFVPISNGCNNFCTYCVVPFTRGREISRPYDEIIKECKDLKKRGYQMVTLLGQNVNSYGSDLISSPSVIPTEMEGSSKKDSSTSPPAGGFARNDKLKIKPIYVKHLGKYRIPTLFPYLLDKIAKIGFEKVDFISSNPWDFSDELIKVIARNKNITRTIHLPIQSGDDNVLKRMNRWYTSAEYLRLISKLKAQISNLKITTDIIVGFCGETDEEFENTVRLCKKVGFSWTYVSVYSQRPMAAATKTLKDDVFHPIKDKRWKILDDLINKPHLKKW